MGLGMGKRLPALVKSKCQGIYHRRLNIGPELTENDEETF